MKDLSCVLDVLPVKTQRCKRSGPSLQEIITHWYTHKLFPIENLGSHRPILTSTWSLSSHSPLMENAYKNLILAIEQLKSIKQGDFGFQAYFNNMFLTLEIPVPPYCRPLAEKIYLKN